MNINGWGITYAPGVSVFPFFPVLSPGGCESTWVAALTVVVAMCCVYCCYTVGWDFLSTVCIWFFHCIVSVHCKAFVVLLI